MQNIIIRHPNNDVLQELGVKRAEGNDSQIIESVQAGSINLIAMVKKILSIAMDCFVEKFIDKMYERIKKDSEACERNPKRDKPIYCNVPLIIQVGNQTISIDEDFTEINISIKKPKR